MLTSRYVMGALKYVYFCCMQNCTGEKKQFAFCFLGIEHVLDSRMNLSQNRILIFYLALKKKIVSKFSMGANFLHPFAPKYHQCVMYKYFEVFKQNLKIYLVFKHCMLSIQCFNSLQVYSGYPCARWSQVAKLSGLKMGQDLFN